MATVALKQYQHYIGGEWVDAADGATFECVQPGHRRALVHGRPRQRRGRAPRRRGGPKKAFEAPSWRGLTQTQRGHLLRRLGDLIAENAERLAIAESTDNGKLIREMRVPARRAAGVLPLLRRAGRQDRAAT